MSEQIKWLVWSNEHRAWWRSNRRGYALKIGEAGRYSLEEARDICINAAPRSGPKSEAETAGDPPEMMVVAPESLVAVSALSHAEGEAPVAEITIDRHGDAHFAPSPNYLDLEQGAYQLYTHPAPQVAVPEAKNVEVLADWEDTLIAKGWNECRAAMLAAAGGETWDAQAYASMRDEIEYWKRRAQESDDAGCPKT